jgi:hypothetical protein
MQFIQPTPAAQLCQTFADIEAFKIINARRAGHEEAIAQPFVPTEYVPVTVAELKARAIQATEESQADKGIDHPLLTCGCGTIWRFHGRSLCPMDSCEEEGTLMILDARKSSNLFVAIYQLELIGKLSFIQPQKGFELGKLRVLLEEYAPWYDRMNRRMIQACYQRVRSRSACDKTALAIEFFKNDFMWASDDENTFCRENDLEWRCPTEE